MALPSYKKPVTLKTTSEIFFFSLLWRLLHKMLASEQISAWNLHPAVEKENVLKNAGKLAWIVTKTSPETDGTHSFGYKPATSQSQHLNKVTFPIERCFLSQMDFNLLPLQRWSQLCHGTWSVCHSAWSSKIWLQTPNSHLPPPLQQSWGDTEPSLPIWCS